MMRPTGKPATTAALIAAAALLLLACSARPCLAFGEQGHRGIYKQALLALMATDDKCGCAIPWQEWQSRWLKAAVYPDAAMTFPHVPETLPAELEVRIHDPDMRIPDMTVKIPLSAIMSRWPWLATLPQYFPYSLNSSDHYFDPTDPSRCADDYGTKEDVARTLGAIAGLVAEEAMRRVPGLNTLAAGPLRDLVKDIVAKAVFDYLKGAILERLIGSESLLPTKRRTYQEYVEGKDGSVGLKGIDGKGYNSVSAILFYLNGRDPADSTASNPSGSSPFEGFVPLARAKEGKLSDAAIALGSAIHYVGDLHSPGHTDWDLWSVIIEPRVELGLNPILLHSQFDDAGDEYFAGRAASAPSTLRPLLSFYPEGVRSRVCQDRGGPGILDQGKYRRPQLKDPAFENQDLTAALFKAAKTSQGLWADKKPTGPEYRAHLETSITLAAGVIDWAFSRVPANADGPYPRDATNFLGMARAILNSADGCGAVLKPEALQGKDCYLGGVDRDDYFPISGSQVSRVSVAVKQGPKEAAGQAFKAEVFDEAGNPIPFTPQYAAGTIDLRLQKRVDKLVLRVYSTDGSAFTYNVTFPPADVQMIVDAEAAVVQRGKPIKFTGKVVDKAGKPVPGVMVGVEDPLQEQTIVLPVDPQGSFSHTCQTPLTKPGVYTFVFLCTQAPEQVYAVGVIDDGYPKVSLSRVQVPLGNWGTIGESFGQRPEVFTTVTRTTTPQGGPPPVLPQPYAPPSDKTQMLATARAWADDIVAGSVEEFTSSPVNVGAVYVAAATCPFPDVTVTKATCAGSVAYIEAAALEAVTKTVFKKAIDSSDLSPQDKEAWKLGVDQAFFVFDVLQLDPKAGPKSAKGVEQTLNMLAVQWDAPQVIFQSVQAPSPGTDAAPRGYVAMPLKSGEVLSIVARGTPPPQDKGMLDLVLCIDKSGSMADDIKAVQEECDATLEALDQFAKANKIDLRVGLVTYTRHDEANWIQGNPLTADVATIRRNIQAISITNLALGKGGNEDMYGALMYAMNEPVGGQKMAMGWRPGAAKIVFPIGDEPPDDPDWEERTLDDVARVAKNLDPVHMYPLLTPKQGSTFLDPAARAMERIATATGGQVFRVASAGDLPETVVAAVKLAVRQHRNEVWRKHNQPYVLYGAIGAVLGLMVLTTVGLILRAALSRPKRP